MTNNRKYTSHNIKCDDYDAIGKATEFLSHIKL